MTVKTATKAFTARSRETYPRENGILRTCQRRGEMTHCFFYNAGTPLQIERAQNYTAILRWYDNKHLTLTRQLRRAFGIRRTQFSENRYRERLYCR
jgi:hypothetical protein